MKYFLISAGLVISSLLGFSDSAMAKGGDVSGGGDAAELEFVAIGQGLVAVLTKDGSNILPQVDPEVFQAAVEGTSILMKRTSLTLNGVPKTAINYPNEKIIEVSRNEWIRLSPVDKVNLAFHEYLGIARLEHGSYSISSLLQGAIGAERIAVIAASAAPNPEYFCKLVLSSSEIIEGATEDFGHTKECGTVVIKRTNTAEEHAGHFAACDAYVVAPLNAWDVEDNFHFSEFRLGIPQKGGLRTSYIYDIYDAPAVFLIRLSYSSGKLLWKRNFTYKLACRKV